jgi:N-glycosylase/DNA lyase
MVTRTMDDLHETIDQLKHSTVRMTIQKRIQEFKTIRNGSSDELFQELCFCILTANFSAERCLQIHSQLKACFNTETKDNLAQKLKEKGYRFPNTRAAYIVTSASKKDLLPTILKTFQGDERRTWLVQNIKGLGYKEASHFLRNIGYDDYAIVDSHILDILARYRLITRPKTLTKKTYIEIETILRRLAHQTQLTLA